MFRRALCGAAMAALLPTAAAAQLSPLLPEAELEDADERDHEGYARRPSIARPHEAEPDQNPYETPFLEWNHLSDGWYGARTRLVRSGIVIESTLTVDASRNLSGGIDASHTVVPYLFDANVYIDTEALGLFPGGSFFIDFQQLGGTTGESIVNDFQTFSNIAAESRTQLAQLWFEQRLSDERIRVKLGKVDANSEFAYVEHGTPFLNSSMGVSPTIQSLPTFPDPAFGINAFVRPVEGVYAGIGVYDGALQSGTRTGIHGPVLRHVFLIGETGLTWVAGKNGLIGRLGLGGWHHSGDFDRFDGGTSRGAAGAYATLDQLLYNESPGGADGSQGLGWFAQYGYADASTSPIEHHFGTGFTWTGAIPGRDADALGLGVSLVRFSEAPGAEFVADFETATELFYSVQVTGFANLTFDLQAITNPGGIANQPDAITGTTRLVLNF